MVVARERLCSGLEPDPLWEEIAACRRCPRMIPIPKTHRGQIPSPFLVVGQAPAKGDGRAYRPFGNPGGGGGLFRWLAEEGIEEEWFRARAYLTALVKCYPGKGTGGKGDRSPSRLERENCAPYLERELALVRPEVVITVGALALGSFLPGFSLNEAVGREFPWGQGRVLIPLPHPSGASLWNNEPANRELRRQAVGLLTGKWPE